MSEVTVIVTTNHHTYPINIIADTSKTPLNYGKYVLPFIKGNQLLIVTNETVAPLYLERLIVSIQSQQDQLLDSLESSISITVKTCILPDGEQYKSQSSIDKIYNALLENHFSRDSTLLALGGGVIGDMTGFAAASYMRGVNFIQIPTTLLAQVDSSVGGKTGINHRLGKNMIGAFWQPELVIADMTTLETLPTTELSAGLAEVVKYALIMDSNFLVWLEENIDGIMQLDYHLLSYVVKKCCELKAQIVSEDEREAGKRALLNFGHTFGHVIETHEGYGTFLHGEAVAIGMVQAAQLSEKLNWITAQDVNRIITLLERCNLPTTPPIIPVDEALALMSHDKKSLSGQVRLILLKGLGNAVLTKNFCHEKLKEVLNNN